MIYDQIAQFRKWIENNVQEPTPMDDKSRLHEFLDVLSSNEYSIPYKDFALKGIGMISMKYSADPIILCGAIPLIRDQLNSSHSILVAQSIRTLTFIANNGGEKDILQEKIHILVRSIVSNPTTPKYIKDMGLKFYFRMLDTPLEHGF